MQLLKFFKFILIFLFFLTFRETVFAQEEFDVSFDTKYVATAQGYARVEQNITLANNLSKVYATSYTLLLEGVEPRNIKASEGGEDLPITTSKRDKQQAVQINFPDAKVGKGVTRNFSILYELPEIATQNGQVWEVQIPKLASPETIKNYKLSVFIPNSFGKLAYISPDPENTSLEGEFQVFEFSKEQLAAAGVIAAFGDFQVFSFKLSYHIQNPLKSRGQTTIAIPPDTAFQRVYYENITPAPIDVLADEDGNWLAVYQLDPGERLDIEVSGSVHLFASPQSYYKQGEPELAKYLKETEYWQISDPRIRKLAKDLKTPGAIYDYIVGNLDYDYSRVRPGVERLGATVALDLPGSAICMEYTDLFIALSRAAGIPAREINGFAYTEDPETQPLSLVADVLHAWPEYWDEEQEIWVPVDPTWGDTTGGVDYFSKFDLSHFAFVIHANDVNDPPPAGSYKLGPTPQKDVKVEFGEIKEYPKSEADVKVKLADLSLPLAPVSGSVTVTNQGPTAIYDLPVKIEASGISLLSPSEEKISIFLPYSRKEIKLALKPSLLPSFSSKGLVVVAADKTFSYTIPAKDILLAQFSILLGILLLLALISFVMIKYHSKITNKKKESYETEPNTTLAEKDSFFTKVRRRLPF